MHVLFVDGDALVAQHVEAALRDRGHKCETVDRGERALALAKAGDYDIVVLEVELPDMDGLHLVRRMKLERVDTPILLQSQLMDAGIQSEGTALGVTEFLAKPYSVGELVARMNATVGAGDEPDLTPMSDPGMAPGRAAGGASAAAPWSGSEPSGPSSTGGNGTTPTPDGGASAQEAAVITDLNGNPIPCVILTKSEETGTLKLSAPDLDCPKSFTLEPVDGSARICVVRWRKGDEIGVEFI